METPTETGSATAISAVRQRRALAAESASEVLMGCVLAASVGQVPARRAAPVIAWPFADLRPHIVFQLNSSELGEVGQWGSFRHPLVDRGVRVGVADRHPTKQHHAWVAL